ncbi:NAD(P)H-hydrate epimerase [Naasia sp. SYSU D00948]|uniref:NAD(P)H-hydrate epimerase n=1 Tax=Naasia sp. SYSU D00948 TaxID=2817379 RepID=UPI001FEED420|nr:NAD(P)H-hydrate epimerase [Naasia sp. SYSU D00948]
MPVGYSAAQIRAAEAPHLANHEPLMQRAAAGLAAEIRGVIAERRRDGRLRHARPCVLLLVGPGNNGGDALYAGAELAAKGKRILVLLVLGRVHEDGLAAALAAGAEIVTDDEAVEAAATADVIVDGIFGTGSSGRSALQGAARDVVMRLQPLLGGPEAPAVVAVDLPSGVDADDGSVPDPAVLPADLTVTFGGMKAGLLLSPARELAGRVRVVQIGIERQLARMEPALQLPDDTSGGQ